MAEVTVPMEETGMLSSIMSEGNEPEVQANPEPAPEPEAQPEGDRARDDKGRFVAKEPEPEKAEVQPVQAEQPAPEKDEALLPSWRGRELREAREAAERRAEEATRSSYAMQQQLQAMQRELQSLKAPKPEPVDFFQNPDEALNQRLAPVQSEIEKFKSDLRLEMSRELAVIKHGEQTVTEVEAAIAKAMQANHPDMQSLAVRMRNSTNPVSVAVEWHKQQKLMEQTGGNLETYREKVLEEAMKDPKFQARVIELTRGQAPATPSIKLPPSLNKATGSGITGADLDDHDMSDAALFRHAAAPARRG